MNETVKLILERYHKKKGDRGQLDLLFEEIAEVMSPDRMGFTNRKRPERRTDKIFDTTPMLAKRGLVNAIGSMLRPKSSAAGKWFDIVTEDENLMDKRAVKDWVDYAEERLWRALYNPKARFIEATGEVDDDLVTFGTGVGYLGLRDDQAGFMFRSFHLANTYIDTDTYGAVNGVHVTETLTAKQAAERWGEENLGEKTREKLTGANKDPNQKFEFVWCVKDRFDYDPRMSSNLNMPFSSIVVDIESEHLVIEEGFEEFPFFIPRWDTGDQEYGRGVGVLALPDVLTLQQMGKTMLRGLHRAVDPPWLLPADSMVNAPQMKPGGVSYYDAKAIRNLGLTNPFQQMESRAQIPWGLNAQQASREQVFQLFYRNVLNLPIEGPSMTATEVIERREMFVREISAVFGRLETDYTGVLIERAFNIMLRKGAFGSPDDIPEELQGSEINFRFASPVEKAKRQIEEANITQGLEKAMAIGQVRPEVLDRFNWDEIAKFIATANDFPSQLTFDDDEVESIKMNNAQAVQMQQGMAMAEQGANIASKVPAEMMEEEAA